ncbi:MULTISPECIES: ABC transporter substrate-binding protein [Bifidobacterium]|jgi:NitT/TauT family transport system substrate-binding protein|uniref:ABC transporter substrate-binding protein n=1 Tax=Bifidobacterium tibiigranuli TaxID=2172043 RepID=A0A5N6RY68_9BIFI|nr:ABC transporter substrate-binding protein [Bifidobacterium tibiigranuli]KAE8127376.1 ABC transporter substrate-binding protein [Bifidobacterium tibiigranuli]KAE8129767.1 ABC transporter substrate-binding protein [Bifidobacterium tibiigranuli]MCI1212276.1 ABC transporter substrate-binding protein [Bifidobacterium tibiigranuli]MCI1221511.1 ABC transporter substrate-binding protein [Bifidobacterium tibiigranuli]
MKHRKLIPALTALIAGVGLTLSGCGSSAIDAADGSKSPSGSPNSMSVRINQAVKTLTYLPLYVAIDQGYFKSENLSVTLDTGGSGSASFSAVLGGSADFSIQDPVFSPKSHMNGGDGVIVAGVMNAPAEYIVGTNSTKLTDNLTALEGKKVIVSPEPDSTWAFMTYLIAKNHLKNVELVNVSIGNELAAVAAGQADYAVVAEPNASKATMEQGLHEVYSFPSDSGWSPYAFSSLTSTKKYVDAHKNETQAVVNAFEKACRYIYDNPDGAVQVGEKEFPDMDKSIVKNAVTHAIEMKAYPEHALVSKEAWKNSMTIQSFIKNVDGLNTKSTSYATNVDASFAETAGKK